MTVHKQTSNVIGKSIKYYYDANIRNISTFAILECSSRLFFALSRRFENVKIRFNDLIVTQNDVEDCK